MAGCGDAPCFNLGLTHVGATAADKASLAIEARWMRPSGGEKPPKDGLHARSGEMFSNAQPIEPIDTNLKSGVRHDLSKLRPNHRHYTFAPEFFWDRVERLEAPPLPATVPERLRYLFRPLFNAHSSS